MKRGIIIYLIASFSIPWTIWIAMNGAGMFGTMPYMIVTALIMWIPALSALIARNAAHQEAGFSWKPSIRGNGGSYLIAWLLPIPVAIIGAVLCFTIFPGSFTSENLESLSAAEGIPSSLAIAITVLSMLPGAIINALFAIGEEAGWRGYLYPELQKKVGRGWAVAITGIIWGIWHTPINMMGYNYSLGYPGYPWTGIAAMCLFCIATGAWCSYLADRTGSLWVAALFHGSVNASAGFGLIFSQGMEATLLGPALSGIIPSLILGALFIALRPWLAS